MSDLYFGEDGDIKLAPNGDLAMVDTAWRNDAQQAYIRIMTEPGDFLLYPELGANMSRLYGMPQTEATGELGKDIIQAALEREGRFLGKRTIVSAIPTGPQTIRFDVYISNTSRQNLVLSIEQELGVQ